MPIVEDAVDLPKYRKLYYVDNYRRVVLALLVMLFITVCQIAVILFLYQTRQEPRFYSTSADGRINPLTPTEPPNQGV